MATFPTTDDPKSEKAIRMNLYGGDMEATAMESDEWESMDEETPTSATRPWAPAGPDEHGDDRGVDVDAAGRPKRTP